MRILIIRHLFIFDGDFVACFQIKELISTMRGDVRVVLREKYNDNEPSFKGEFNYYNISCNFSWQLILFCFVFSCLILGKHAFEWFEDHLQITTLKDKETLLRNLVRLGYVKQLTDANTLPANSRYYFASVCSCSFV